MREQLEPCNQPRDPPRPRPPGPPTLHRGPQHLPGGLCAGLWRAERFSAAAFSRTVAMAVAARSPPPQTAAPRSERQRGSRQLTRRRSQAPPRPALRGASGRGHVRAGAARQGPPRARGEGAAPALKDDAGHFRRER